MTGLGFAVPKALARAIVVAITAALVLVGLAAFDPAHASDGDGGISGTVTAPVGAVGDWWTGLKVSAHSVETDTDFETYPDENGDYLIDDLAPGDYLVAFGPNPWAGEPTTDALSVYYPGTYDVAGAQAVTVQADATTESIDGQASYGGGISGQVTAPEGTVPNWWQAVQVHVSGPVSKSGVLGEDGTFSFAHLQPGAYSVSFVVGSYDDGAGGDVDVDLESGAYPDSVEVADGAVTDGITVELHAAAGGDDGDDSPDNGSLSGHVTAPEGADPNWWQAVRVVADGLGSGSAQLDSNGDYIIDHLDAGDYLVLFEVTSYTDEEDHDVPVNLITEFYDNAYTSDDAQRVDVDGETTTTGIDADLEAGGTLTGHVSAPEASDPDWWKGVYVIAQGDVVRRTAQLESNGDYSITGLVPGSYTVQFSVGYYYSSELDEDVTVDLTSEYYDDALSADDATPVSVTGDDTTSGVDAVLDPSGTISGQVEAPGESDPNWWQGVTVNVYSAMDAAVASVPIGEDGNYSVRGLAPGDYTVEFSVGDYWPEDATSPVSVTLLSEYWDNARDANEADTVAVVGGATTTGIDASLELSGTITGHVDAPGYDDPNWWRGVVVMAVDGPSAGQQSLDENGNFTITGLEPGDYKVEFSVSSYWDEDTQGDVPVDLTSEYYDNVFNFDAASPVSVTGGAATSGIDATLTRSATISGTVTAPAASDPDWWRGVTVHAYGLNAASASLNADGTYAFHGLAPGTYTVYFDVDPYWTIGSAEPVPVDLAPEYWDNSATVAHATPLSLGVGESRADIDATLTAEGPDLEFDLRPTPNIPTSATFGDTLDVTLGTWSPTPDSFTYQWFRGATEVGSGNTYALQPADVGAAITVKVTAHRAGFADATVTSNTVIPDAATFSGGTVTVSGTASLGEMLSAELSDVTPTPAPENVSWTWQCDGTAIDGATANTHIVTVADAGCSITAVATFSKEGYADRTATSSARQVPHYFGTTPAPTIPSTATLDDTLNVNVGTWDPTPTTFSYQWFRGTTEIGTESTYTVQAADVGESITIKVTAHRAGYADTTVTSNAVTPVAKFSGGTVTISGTGVEGAALTATLTGVSPTPESVSWQWLCNNNSNPIAGAVGAAYVVTGDDHDCTLKAVATFSKPGYATGSVTSESGTRARVHFLVAPRPTIPTSALPGDVLTVITGEWTPAAPNYSYQWYINGVVIVGEDGPTYTVRTGDVDQAITVRVTGLRPFYIPDPSEPSNVVKPSYPPLTPGSPTIVGTAVVGSSLTAHEGTWATDQFTYQWLRDGASIGGATKRVYAISAADAGHAVAVRVTGSRTGYSSTSATSSGVAISAGSFSVPTLPSFTGTYALGRVLTAAPGTWSPAPTTYAYQWYRNGDAILGATSATYALTSADQGTKISVVVTASKVGYNTLTKNSAQVTMPKFFTTTPTPTISGTLRSGHTLTAKPGTWSPSATLTYQWYRNGAKISKATKSTYELTTTDRGKKITVVVTGKKTGYGTIAMTSAAKTVYYEFSKAPTPTISGTLKSGHTLTAKAGTWSPTPTKTYQWYRSGKAIAGATKSTYKLTSSDKGKKITVKVTGKRTGYLTVTKTSAAKTVAK